MRPFSHIAPLRAAVCAVFVSLLASAVSFAADASLKGKSLTIILGSDPGGTTDFAARLMAEFLAKYLPGAPNVVVENRPGAHSLTALNYFALQVKPDGLTAAVGSTSQLLPQNYRVPQSHYDPSKFAMVGGINIGGSIVIIHNEALSRLTDKNTKPLFIAATGNSPNVGELMAAWGIGYLGWNVQWVPGYPADTAAEVQALMRGEIDIAAFSITGLDSTLLDRSKYTILYQSGLNGGTEPSPMREIAGIPLFPAALRGKIVDPLSQKAFSFWIDSSTTVDWLALPPGTPKAIVETYRAAFRKAGADPEFLRRGKVYSPDFSPVTSEWLTSTTQDLAQAAPEVVDFMPQLLRKQGLNVN